MTPTLFTSCNALPPARASFPWGGPSENSTSKERYLGQQ